MDAQELRIGDFIYFECENLHMTTVGEILSINTNLDRFKSGDDKGKFIYTVNMKDQWGNIRNEEQLIDIEPIPLTEEWLLRFGFESNPYQDRYELGEIYIDCDKTRGKLELWESKTNIIINTVHQLQNLYFALTGKELELKDK